MPKKELIGHDVITVKTQEGDCQIQLCLGDITKLQKKEQVDVIFVSSFGGNYEKIPGTVIGALYENLGIDVAKLAEDKEEDLRVLYSCWWSKPLPSNLPYRRVLCFESRRFRAGRPQELVGHAFRCLVPILKNKDASVITPLLSTGNQGYDPCVMLDGMVQAAVSWVKAGLAIKLLKIVVYAKLDDSKPKFLRGCNEDILKKFQELKERYESANLIPMEVTLEYDVYLSYSEKDQEVADRIQACLLEEKPDVRIYNSRQKLDAESFWQDQMYELMTKSARVLTVLTPSYLSSEACMEQYNIALCCNRQAHRNILAPFFVETVSLPTYMGLVQYADCREDLENGIARACGQLVKSLTATDKVVKVATTDPNLYDIFISYCHADSNEATPFVNKFKRLNPGLKIFYDIQELKTGHEWQRTLYHSIDGTSCMIALISPKYLKSAVCMEEYSLAQMKHLAGDKLHLVPVCIADGQEVDFAKISCIPMLDARPQVYEKSVSSICSAVVSWLETDSFNHLSDLLKKDVSLIWSPHNEFDVQGMMEEVRSARFMAEYRDSLKSQKIFPPTLDKLTDAADGDDGKEEAGDDGKQEKGQNEENSETKEEDKADEAEKGAEAEMDGKAAEGETSAVTKKEGAEQKNEEKKEASEEEKTEVDDGQNEGEKSDVAYAGIDKKGGAAASSDVGDMPEQSSSKKHKTTVVFSYHESDIKFVYHLRDLLKEFAPNVALRWQFASDQERLDSLEAADSIVALLSPSYIESPQHVEEFHIGLWRQRVSPALAPLLIPVQVAMLPKRPSYFQLVGSVVNTWDAFWANLTGVQRIESAGKIMEIRHALGRQDLPKLSPDELLPMTEAAQVLMMAIKARRTIPVEDPPKVRPALVNTVKLQAELDTLKGQKSPSLAKYLLEVPSQSVPKQGSKSCAVM
ncbi:uncharacterized protein [Diadema antillarum]|uniref:uncharacterized protein n=1 Tax=Diadema antillarum TaxID=105358 RepID=UPI003A85C897